MKTSEGHRAARWYAKHRGWSVFFVPDGGRPPSGWQNLATSRPDAIDSLWHDAPGNPALRVGPHSGVMVIDIDPRNGGTSSLRQLEKRFGPLPRALTVETGGGGQHYYFIWPPELAEIVGHRAKLTPLSPEYPGVDLLIGTDQKGAFVYLPPTRREKHGRKRYRWVERGADAGELPVAWLRGIRELVDGQKQEVSSMIDGSIPEGQRDDTLFRLACSWRGKGLSGDVILAALIAENERRCVPPLPTKQVQKIARQAARHEQGAHLDRVVETGEDEDGRPVILVRKELTSETDEALAAIRQLADHGMYLRGDQLVRVARYREIEDERVWKRRPPDAPALTPVTLDSLLGVMDRAARWLTRTVRGKVKSAYPPKIVAQQLLDRRFDLGFPPLEFVTETPLLTCDGVTSEGYDPRTKILYLPNTESGVRALPDLAGLGTKALRREARAAADALLDPARDFPFTDDESRAVYLAGILNVPARPAIRGPIPLISCEAPSPGTGKTLLVSIMSLIAAGRAAGVTVMADEAEMRKRITSLCLDGAPIVLIDNVSGTVSSNALAALATTTMWEDRVLGVNKTAKVPNTAQWFLTGNNHVFSGDLGRRVLPIVLDSDREDPENRSPDEFRYPRVLDHVAETRPGLVSAGLTILRAFQLAGMPSHGKPRMGSFEAWDDFVRAAIVWATGWDPASTDDPTRGRGRIRADANVDAANVAAFLSALRATFRKETFTAADVFERTRIGQRRRSDLVTALERLATDRKGNVTVNSIGQVFRNYRDARYGKLKLIKEVERTRRTEARWRVVRRPPRSSE